MDGTKTTPRKTLRWKKKNSFVSIEKTKRNSTKKEKKKIKCNANLIQSVEKTGTSAFRSSG